MDTKTLASALVGFMLGGLVVSIAAELEDGPAGGDGGGHGAGIHRTALGHTDECRATRGSRGT